KTTLWPYLDFDIITNRVILHAEQIRYDETFLTKKQAARRSIYYSTSDYSTCLSACNTPTNQPKAMQTTA
ncbi:MAG: hypothetical protein ACKPKO_42825, partial [Candidatus Fonsibacter sp.]